MRRPGTDGEQLARLYLERQGWTIVKANFKANGGEIDLIAEEQTAVEKVLVFVEVKTRKHTSASAPIESVNARKRARLIAAATAYIAKLSEEPACRFDVIEVVTYPGGLSEVRLHRAAFGADG